MQSIAPIIRWMIPTRPDPEPAAAGKLWVMAARASLLREDDVPDEPRADEPREVASEIEIRIVGKCDLGRLVKRSASCEREQECCATRRQRADLHVEIRADHERVLAAPILNGRKLLLAAVHRPDRHERISRANDFGRGMHIDADTADSLGIKRR